MEKHGKSRNEIQGAYFYGYDSMGADRLHYMFLCIDMLVRELFITSRIMVPSEYNWHSSIHVIVALSPC